MIEFLKYFLPLRFDSPIYLIQFVTSKCVGKCRHCFYWRDLNKSESPMSPDEVYKTASGLGPVLQWLVTGGEPYLRDDLDDLIEAFYKARAPYNIAIATSGYFPEKIVPSASRLIESCRRSNFIFGFPIEGVGKINDEIRGVAGFYDRTRNSIDALMRFKRSLPKSQKRRLTVLVDITLSALNAETAEETYYHVRDQIAPDAVNVILARGEVRDPAAANPDVAVYDRINSLIERDIADGKMAGYGGFTRLVNAKDKILRKTISSIYSGGDLYYPCAAGDLIGVVSPEGDVSGCESMPDVFGNLREQNYDLKKIWNSEKAGKFRKRIREDKCKCIHQCFLSPSIFFNTAGIARIGMETILEYIGKGKR